jgi:hypothetical protein
MCVRDRRWGAGKTSAMARARLGFSAMKRRMEASFAARVGAPSAREWQSKKEGAG